MKEERIKGKEESTVSLEIADQAGPCPPTYNHQLFSPTEYLGTRQAAEF